MNETVGWIIVACAFPVFFGLWFWRKKNPRHKVQYKKNLKRVESLRKNGKHIDIFDWDKKNQLEEKNAFIELFDGNKAIYHYVYGINGEFYEWECKYETHGNQIFLQPYFNTRTQYNKHENRRRFQIFEITNNGLKYIGETIVGSSNKPKRTAPYSQYVNFNKR